MQTMQRSELVELSLGTPTGEVLSTTPPRRGAVLLQAIRADALAGALTIALMEPAMLRHYLRLQPAEVALAYLGAVIRSPNSSVASLPVPARRAVEDALTHLGRQLEQVLRGLPEPGGSEPPPPSWMERLADLPALDNDN